MQSGHDRLVRLATAWLRPPLVTPDGKVSTMVTSRVESRVDGAIGVVCATALLALVAAASPWWVAVVVLVVGFAPLVAYVERVVLAWELPAGHVRWSDVRSGSPGSGAGERALEDLLALDTRPVVLEVDAAAAGLVGMYGRLGFVTTGQSRRRRGRVLAEMTRNGSGSAGPETTEPTEGDLVVASGAGLATAALAGLSQPVAVVAVFVLVLAAMSDWRLHRISNSLMVAAGAVLLSLAVDMGEWRGALVGAALAAGPLLAMNLLTGGRSPGMGDVKLAGVAGLAIGTVSAAAAGAAVIAGLLAGGLFGAAFQSMTGRREFPLGVPLAVVFAAVVLGQVVTGRGWL
jgi:leader peptidase (prepilin peptidase)/N-methyltransferase